MMSAHKYPADHYLFIAFQALLCWAPLPFGSNRPWGMALLFLGAALLLLWWLTLLLTGRIPHADRFKSELAVPVILLLLVQVGVFIQTIPLPRGIVEMLSPHAADLQLGREYIPLSLDPQLTRFQLLEGLSCLIGFVLMGVLVNRRERLRRILWTLVLSGGFQAVFGVMMTISGLEYGFFVEKYSGQGVATGTFINRNHLAGYLVMTLAAGIGLLISQLGSDLPGTTRAWFRELAALLLGTKFRLRLLLALMVIGLVLTRSRMGNLSFFLSLTLAGAVSLLSSERRVPRRVALLLASLLLVDLFIVGRWFGTEQLAERLVQTSVSQESRVEVSGYSLGIIQDYPWTGAGAGTFYTVFPHYAQSELNGDYYVHAHNDFVELAGDLGLPLSALLLLFTALTLWQAFRLQFRCESRLDQGAGFTVLMVLAWGAIHSSADFNLYIPANAFTWASMLALAWVRRSAE